MIDQSYESRNIAMPANDDKSLSTLLGWVRRRWVAFGCVGALSVYLSVLLFQRSLKLPSDALGANGMVLSAWGLLITISGFGLTIWQLQKTQSATLAATKAVQMLKSRILTYDAVIESQRALSAVRESQRHLKVDSWDNVLDSYGNLRTSLTMLSELPSLLDEIDRTPLTTMLTEIGSTSTRIERGLQRGSVVLDKSRMLSSTRDYEQRLIKISIALQREIA